jgi:hypothetical protein
MAFPTSSHHTDDLLSKGRALVVVYTLQPGIVGVEQPFPFIRLNETGYDHCPSMTVYDGDECKEIRLDRNGCTIVGVAIGIGGTVTVNPEELKGVEQFVTRKDRILRPTR